MNDFKVQLVIQFAAASTLGDFDRLVDLEEAIRNVLQTEADAVVDGHDFGMGEFNIFIHTNEPRAIFERVAKTIEITRPGLPFSAGYRDFNEDDYIPLWPVELRTFSVA